MLRIDASHCGPTSDLAKIIHEKHGMRMHLRCTSPAAVMSGQLPVIKHAI